MNGLVMMLIAIIFPGAGYLLYGRRPAGQWGIESRAKPPAYDPRDGVDCGTADTPGVFGHRFVSVAGAGPINGPIRAAVFGRAPVPLRALTGGVKRGPIPKKAAGIAR